MRPPAAHRVLLAVVRPTPHRPPHVSPMIAFDDGTRFWMSTSRRAFKTRAIDACGRASLLVRGACVPVDVDRFDWTRPTDWFRAARSLPSTALGTTGYGVVGTPYALWYLIDARDVPEQWRPWSRTLLRATPGDDAGAADVAGAVTVDRDDLVDPHGRRERDPEVLRRLYGRMPDHSSWPAASAWHGPHGHPALRPVRVDEDPTAEVVVCRFDGPGPVPAPGAALSVTFDGSSGFRAATMRGATLEGRVRDGGAAAGTCVVDVTRGWFWTGWDHRRI